MQLSTLNKVVSLFLVGSVSLLLGAMLNPEKLQAAIARGADAGLYEGRAAALLLVVGALIFFGLSAWVGAIVESLTDLTIRRLLKSSASHRWIAAWFRQEKIYKTFSFWRKESQEAAIEHGASVSHVHWHSGKGFL